MEVGESSTIELELLVSSQAGTNDSGGLMITDKSGPVANS